MKKKGNKLIAVLLLLATVVSLIGGAGVFADEDLLDSVSSTVETEADQQETSKDLTGSEGEPEVPKEEDTEGNNKVESSNKDTNNSEEQNVVGSKEDKETTTDNGKDYTIKINISTEVGGSAYIKVNGERTYATYDTHLELKYDKDEEVSVGIITSTGYCVDKVLSKVLDKDISEDIKSPSESGSSCELLYTVSNDDTLDISFKEGESPFGYTDGSKKKTRSAKSTAELDWLATSAQTGGHVICANDRNEVVSDWGEGILAADGIEAFCMNYAIKFKRGTGTARDAVGMYGLSQEDVNRIAVTLLGAERYMAEHPPSGNYRRYYIKQVIVWKLLSEMLGWGIVNTHLQASFCPLAYQSAVLDAAWLFWGEHGSEYIGHGTVWENGANQPVARFSTEHAMGKAKVKKYSTDPQISDNNPCYSLAGGEWGIFTDRGCTNKVATLTSNESGVTGEVELTKGTYYVKELKAPKGFAVHIEGQPTEVKEINVEAGKTTTVDFYDMPGHDPFNILVEKMDKDSILNQGNASLEGAVFQLDYYTDSSITKNQILEESVIPKDSYLFKTKEVRLDNGNTVCRINVYDPDCYVGSPTGSELYVVNGLVTFPIGTIAVKEVTPPEGYHIEGSVIEVPDSGVITDNLVVKNITTDGISSPIHVYQASKNKNEINRGSIVVYKRDIETGLSSPQGDAQLSDAWFRVYNKSKNSIWYDGDQYVEARECSPNSYITTRPTVWSETYNAYVAVFDNLPYGDYAIEEVTSSTGYIENLLTPEDWEENTIHEVTASIRDHNEVVVLSGTPNECIRNYVIHGGVKVRKRDHETKLGEAREDTTLAGAVFEIVNLSTNPVIVEGKSYANGQVVKTITTNEQGIAQTSRGLLPYGSYRIQEVTAPTGFLHEGKLTTQFRISEHGEIVDVTSADLAISNLPIRGDLEFLKVKGKPEGEEKDELDPLEGARFEIVSKKTGQVKLTVESDEHGIVSTKGMGNSRGALVYGTYIVREIYAPPGYEKIEPFEFKIREEGITVQYIYQEDKLIETPVRLIKKDKSTGKTIPLANTTFELLDSDKNVITLEQFYPNHTVLNKFKTDDSGSFTLPKKLRYGTYYFREVQAPNGYLRGQDLQFEVEEGRKWDNPLVLEYLDDNAMGKLHLVKKDSLDNSPLAGATFQITAKSDIRTNDGTIRYRQGDLVDTITSNSQGIAESKLLYIGEYNIQEKSTPDGYTLDDTVRSFTIQYVNQDTPVYVYNMELKNKPTEFNLLKKDIDGVKLVGIKFDITNNTTGEKVSKVTDANGNINIKYIKRGSYKIEEKETLPGYVLDTQPRYFVVTQEGYIKQVNSQGTPVSGSKDKSNKLDLEWVNDYTKVDFSKHDITGTKEVKGATLQVLSAQGNVVYEWESGTVPHRIVKIPVGSYVLHEAITPAGYVTSNDVPFTVQSTGNVQRFSMTDKQVFAIKVDVDDNALSGAVLAVKDNQGNIMDTWTSSGKSHAISGLHVGQTYTLHETSTPEGYVTALPVTFTVEDNTENQTIKMYDKRVDIKKKDVDGNMLPNAKLAVYDKSNILIDEWVTSTKEHYVSGLIVGETYVLKEIEPPAGYVRASNIEFTVTEENENQHYSMVDKRVKVSKTDVTGEDELEGASLKVVDAEGNVVDEWVSSKEQHYISGLEVNNSYTLIEVIAPEGYVKASSIDFYVPEDGNVQMVHMVDKRVSVSKKEITGDKELPGATITVKDDKDNVVDEWVSSKEPHYVSNLEVGKTYTLTETITPGEYVTASTITFKVNDDGVDQVITMVDKQVEVSKTDVTGEKEVEGATLTVKDSNGEVVDEWVSGKKPHFVSGLSVNKEYTLIETLTPNGYVTASEVKFSVPEDNKIQKVHMVDKQVFVTKTDVIGDEEVIGAHLVVKDKEGNVVDEWVSGEEPHPVSGLEVGKEYVLIEEQAPNGYVIAEEIEFTVEDNGEIQHVEMHDKQVFINKSDLIKLDEELSKPVIPDEEDTKDETENEDSDEDSSENLEDEETSDNEEPTDEESSINKDTKYVKFSKYPFKGFIDKVLDFFDKDSNKVEDEPPMVDSGEGVIEKVVSPKTDSTDKDKVTNGKEEEPEVLWSENPEVENSKFSTEEELRGRRYLVGTKLQVQDLEGNVVDEWVTDGNTYAVSNLVIGETYNLVEVEATKGYVRSVPYQFTVEKTDENQFILMKDKQVVLYKKDMVGEELQGATIIITDEKDRVVDRWVSSKEPHAIENLEEGKKYKFKEESAPDGYIVVEEFEFIVDESLTNLHIEVTDDHTRTEISKQDATTGKELAGAQLTLYDSENNKVESWTSSNEPHMIERLKPGKYRLHEDLAPIGYKTASDVTFEVKAVPDTLKVVMKDEVQPKIAMVQTGENIIIIGLIVIIILILVYIYIKRRR